MSGVTGGVAYGSIYQPVLLGARGGSGPGGKGTRGGGRMRIRVGHKFILNGILAADGVNVVSGTGESTFKTTVARTCLPLSLFVFSFSHFLTAVAFDFCLARQ